MFVVKQDHLRGTGGSPNPPFNWGESLDLVLLCKMELILRLSCIHLFIHSPVTRYLLRSHYGLSTKEHNGFRLYAELQSTHMFVEKKSVLELYSNLIWKVSSLSLASTHDQAV